MFYPIISIKTATACFGVNCPQHCLCARYHAVDGATHVDIGTCVKPDGSRPLFVAVDSYGQMRLF
jgi:hypothetical protein